MRRIVLFWIEARARARLCAVALAACGAFCGCGGQPQKKPDVTLLPLWEWLPGHYDNEEQREQDRHAGRVPPASLRLAIVAVKVPMLGEHVYYEQESTDEYPPHVTQQHLLVFTPADKPEKPQKPGEVVEVVDVVEAIWNLTDPPRWRGGVESPELFTGVQPPDVKLDHGCELNWKHEGEHFSGASDRQKCRTVQSGVGSVYTERRVEVGPEGLAVSNQSYDADGRLVSGRQGDPFVHFRRAAGS
jgi:CpeT/CpcT family (DUF1001)